MNNGFYRCIVAVFLCIGFLPSATITSLAQVGRQKEPGGQRIVLFVSTMIPLAVSHLVNKFGKKTQLPNDQLSLSISMRSKKLQVSIDVYSVLYSFGILLLAPSLMNIDFLQKIRKNYKTEWAVGTCILAPLIAKSVSALKHYKSPEQDFNEDLKI
jgi:hypothetical protein